MEIRNNISFGMALKMPTKYNIRKNVYPKSAQELQACGKHLKHMAKDVDITLEIVEHPIKELNKVRIIVTPSIKTPLKKILSLIKPQKYTFIDDQYINCGEDVFGRVISSATLGRHNILSK